MAYIESLSEPPHLAAPTIVELYGGIRGKQELATLDRLISSVESIALNEEIAILAGHLWRKYRPSHGLDAVDAMIAATADYSRCKLVTLNLKHFPLLGDLKRPY